MTRPPLVLAAHGSPHPAHRPAVEALVVAVRSAGVPDVRVGWIDFFAPTLGEAAAACPAGPVVVPLLLAAGHHARVDVPAMVAGVPGARVSGVLGPDRLLATALHRLLGEAGVDPGTTVVLAAAGSSDPSALAQTEAAAGLLAERRGQPVPVAYASGSGARVGPVVTSLRDEGREVAVATYLLSPGALADRIAEQALAAGAAVVTPALGDAPEVVEVVLQRWSGEARASVGA